MTETSYNGKGWFWKPIALFLMGVILSGSLMVVREHVMLRDFITKAEAKEMVDKLPYPWISDRKYVIESLKELKNDTEYIKKHMWKNNQ